MEKPKLVLRVGKKYILRNGLITEPLKLNTITNYKFEAALIGEQHFKSATIACWLQGGAFLTNAQEHPLDIIEEYQTAVAEG